MGLSQYGIFRDAVRSQPFGDAIGTHGRRDGHGTPADRARLWTCGAIIAVILLYVLEQTPFGRKRRNPLLMLTP